MPEPYTDEELKKLDLQTQLEEFDGPVPVTYHCEVVQRLLQTIYELIRNQRDEHGFTQQDYEDR